jgi:tRNA pseudouridine13 synthase
MQMPGAFEYQVIRYHQPDEEINVTELQGFREAKPLESNKGGKKRDVSEILPATVDEDASALNTIAHDDSSRDIPNLKRARVNEEGASTGVVPSSTPRYLALQLKFSLESGCYATMLLREVMKMSTETSHHAMLSHGGK